MSNDIVDFIGAKAAATTTFQLDDQAFDLDLWLVQRGLDRRRSTRSLPTT
jgi:hypothetical protein